MGRNFFCKTRSASIHHLKAAIIRTRGDGLEDTIIDNGWLGVSQWRIRAGRSYGWGSGADGPKWRFDVEKGRILPLGQKNEPSGARRTDFMKPIKGGLVHLQNNCALAHSFSQLEDTP